MKRNLVVFLSICVAIGANPPLKLIQTVPLPGVQGDFDHFLADVKGNRLFLCAEGNGSVEVFDLGTTKHIRSFGKGVVQEPHSLLYREDLNRIYVVDGTATMGAVRIYDGRTYNLIKSLDLPPFADWSDYDPATKYLYVNGNGSRVKKPYSTISIIDTTTGELAGTITVDDNVITGFALETSNQNLYTGMRDKHQVAVIDRKARKVIATWPFTPLEGSNVGFMAIDTANHRLFENFANHRVTEDAKPGEKHQKMIVYDTQAGKEVTTIPINEHTDHLQYDPGSKRLFVVAAVPPTVEVIQQVDPDHYKSLGEIITEPKARIGLYVPERRRFYVAVPKRESVDAHVLVYEVQ